MNIFKYNEDVIKSIQYNNKEKENKNRDLYLKLEQEILNKLKRKDYHIKELISYDTCKILLTIEDDIRWLFCYNLSIDRIDGIIYINKNYNILMRFLPYDGGVLVDKQKYHNI